MTRFRDRAEAGRLLGEEVLRRGLESPAVFGLPRGGVVVAVEVARVLGCALEVVVARKVGHPGNPEYAIGAVAAGGASFFNEEEVGSVDREWLQHETERQREEAERRQREFGAALSDLNGRTAVVVDDGIATGYTMLAAVACLRERVPERIVVAVPVAAARTLRKMRGLADDVIALQSPEAFFAIGEFYEEFGQISDRQVRALLAEPAI